MINYVIDNYKGKPNYVINADGKEVLSSYNYQMSVTTPLDLIITLY